MKVDPRSLNRLTSTSPDLNQQNPILSVFLLVKINQTKIVDYEFLDIKQCVTYSVSTYFYDHLYTNIQTEEIRLTGSNCCLLCPPLKPHLEITRRKAEEPNKIVHFTVKIGSYSQMDL